MGFAKIEAKKDPYYVFFDQSTLFFQLEEIQMTLKYLKCEVEVCGFRVLCY